MHFLNNRKEINVQSLFCWSFLKKGGGSYITLNSEIVLEKLSEL